MKITENTLARLSKAPNTIIRKHMKSRRTCGQILLEMFDEYISGEDTGEVFTARMKRWGIHPYLWYDLFPNLMVRRDKRLRVDFSEKDISMIMLLQRLSEDYKSMSHTQKNMAESIFLSLIFPNTKKG